VKINAYLLALKYKRAITGVAPIATMAFYPQPSGPWYNAWLAARMGGIDLIDDPNAADAVFVFDDKTESDTGKNLSAEIKPKAINHRINDISKTHVGKVFKDVFGYSVDIDPLTYRGRAAENKLIEKRFGTDYDHVDVWTADQAFSPEEQTQLINFCEAMGLDFGAVDVMRDKHDGRIYVVDVNKTCMPVLCLSQKSQRAAIREISASLIKLIERVKSA